MSDGLKRILSIQSHVVHGYVGNRASTFPLQLLSWDVDVLNTVSFSNHTGYTQWQGERHSAQYIRQIFEGLKMNTLTEYDCVLTGYIPGAEAVAEAGSIVRELRQYNPELIWILDPVMGDESKLYVSPDVIPVYESLLKDATVITPNQFEAELLSGQKTFSTMKDVSDALTKIYEKFHTPNIVISSIIFSSSNDTPPILPSDKFVLAGQTIVAGREKPVQFFMVLPFIDQYFTGTGDLFAAIMSDKFHYHTTKAKVTDATPNSALPFVLACEETSAIVQAVLQNTAKAVSLYNTREDLKAIETGIPRPEKGTKERRIMDMKFGELRLIQSEADIRSAKVEVRAQFEFDDI
ncbi:Ribokinase-like protein [Dipodascopsis uninucleata]